MRHAVLAHQLVLSVIVTQKKLGSSAMAESPPPTIQYQHQNNHRKRWRLTLTKKPLGLQQPQGGSGGCCILARREPTENNLKSSRI